MFQSATVWDDPRNIETLAAMWTEGASASEIATALGQGVTRNAVIGKVTRLKLPPHRRNHVVQAARPAQHGNKGVPKASAIIARMDSRNRIEEARQRSTIAAHQLQPFRAGSLPTEQGVDFTGRMGFASRRIGRDCSWIFGEPTDGAVCCGKPVKEGTQWCPDHYARVYSGRGQ